MDQAVVDDALRTLDGIRQITKNEMLIHGEYVTDNVRNKKLAAEGAVCGGRKACLVGSAYIAYGVPLQITEHYDYWREKTVERVELPGIGDKRNRAGFRRYRPGLRLAMEALNDAAERKLATLSERRQRAIRENVDDGIYPDLAESLFETGKGLNREDVLKLVTQAKRIVGQKAKAA